VLTLRPNSLAGVQIDWLALTLSSLLLRGAAVDDVSELVLDLAGLSVLVGGAGVA
jgi:hypothetical protein